VDEHQPRAIVADGVELPVDAATVDQDQNIGSKIVSGGAWRIVAYIGSTVLAVASTSIISREIGPINFAEFTTCLSLLAVAMQISDFGLLALGVREYAAQTGAARVRGFRAMTTLRFAFSIVAAAVIMAFAALAGFSNGLMLGLAAASIGLLFNSLQSSYIVPLQATYRLNALARLDVTRQALTSGLMVAAALLVGGVGSIIAVNLPVALVMVFLAVVLVRGEVPLLPSWNRTAMRELLADVGTFAVAASIGTLYAYIAQIVSDAVLTPFESGQFALAFRVYSVMLLGWMVAVSGAFPLLVTSSRDDVERMVYATRRLVQTSLLVGTVSLVGLVTGADFVVAVLGGPEFTEAAELIAIIGLALPATFTLVTGSTVLLASGRHRELVSISVVGATLSIAMTWFAATQWGGVGAALGIVVGELLIASGYLVVVRRIDRDALPRLRWVLAVAVAGVLGCAVALLSLPGLVAALVGGAVFLLAGLALNIFPPELTDRIPLIRSSGFE
jgi:O-antigen/teichoic acid export membrane protein